MDDLKQDSKTRLVLRWVGSLLTIILLVYLFSRQGWGEIIAAIRQIPTWHLLLAFALTLISRIAVSFRWYALLAVSDMDITWQQVIKLTFAGLFASNFLPTTVGGDVVRLAGAVQLKFDAAISAASLVVDRLVGLFGMALAVPLGAGPLWKWLIIAQGWKSVFSSDAILSAKGISRRIRKGIGRLMQAFVMWKSSPMALMISLGMTGIHMLCLYSSISLLLSGMSDPMPVWLIAGLWSFVYLITLVPISINGYGVQEVALTLMFTNIGGISLKSGLTIAVLVRTMQMLASLPGAAYVPSILVGIRQREAQDG
jgi:glycosyltransferase 2 family protein